MPADHIIAGQVVSPDKLHLAKEFRRHMTRAEQLLWQEIRTNRLDSLHFRRQQIIDGFIVDFYCHKVGLVVEIDGDVHNQQTEYDAERDRILEARGLRVLRFANRQIERDLPGVLDRIRSAAAEGGT